MRRKHAHTLATLIELCYTKVKFKWTDVEKKAFIAMKKIPGREILLYYPIFNERFILHTEDIKTHHGKVISKNGKPTAFYLRKITPTQTNYTNTEKELLSMVATLK